MKALVGDIRRYSVHDGPGIRTTVFFKGCNFSCPWCHNPELISKKIEVLYYQNRCIGCGDCVGACPQRAIQGKDTISIDQERCHGCGACVDVCCSAALEMVGREYSVDELFEVLMRDLAYYESSGGGVTLSGGEPTLQIHFIVELLQLLKANGIHTVLETNGSFSSKLLDEGGLALLDLIYFDLKVSGSTHHKHLLRADDATVLKNLDSLSRLCREKLVIRIPLVPAMTARKCNLRGIARRLRDLGLVYYELVPYHSFGLSKWRNLGKKWDSRLPIQSMEREELRYWEEFMKENISECKVREVEHAN